MKRFIDVLISAIASGILFIPMLFIAIIIKLTSQGSIIYWSTRVGQRNIEFSMPKFRSMIIGTPEVATHLLTDPDVYLTTIGRLLRQTSLDELPQLWSVLLGDMSLVGPRPTLTSQIQLNKLRSQYGVNVLKPGITGWAQVNGRDNLNDITKVAFDVEYLERQSLVFDIRILLITIKKVLERDNVSH